MSDQSQDKYLKKRSRKRSRSKRRGSRSHERPEEKKKQEPKRVAPKEQEHEPGPREVATAVPLFLSAEQVTEEHFEEELFTGEWEPSKGYVRVVDIMTVLMRNAIVADAGDYTLYSGEDVVLSTEKGIETGRVLSPPEWRRCGGEDLKVKILRVVGHSDVRQMSRNKAKELIAFDQCRSVIEKLKLEMKLLRAQYLHGGGRVIFYFTARQRVDFRQLVKELHSVLHVRVELKQIGVRDAVKMEGGVGPCGLHVCCNRFLSSFKPVSVRMVKEQNMMMNPQKVSGICGRLLCCLEYEHKDYSEHFYHLPVIGQHVRSPEGEGEVVDLKVLEEEVKVQDRDGNAKWWRVSDLEFKAQSADKAAAFEDVDEDISI